MSLARIYKYLVSSCYSRR